MLDTIDRPEGLLRGAMLCGALAAVLALGACGQPDDAASDTAEIADVQEPDSQTPDDMSSDASMPDEATDDMALGGDLYVAPPPESDPAVVAARATRVAALADIWPAEPVYTYAFDAMDPSVSVSAGVGGSLFDPADDYWGLPRTEGYEQVDLNCTACHSLRIVMQQHQTEERWDYLLTWMVEEQGMYPMPEDERALVLAYLLEHFGPAADTAD